MTLTRNDTEHEISVRAFDDATDEDLWGEVSPLRRWLRRRRQLGEELAAQRNDFNTRLISRGPKGRHGGVVYGKPRYPATVESTAQLRGTYPFVTDSQNAMLGQYVGREVFTGAAFGFDPIVAYQEKVVSSPAMSVSGVVGSSKSSLAKTICLRGIPFGRKFAIPGDIRGEYVPIARTLGITPIVLGAGSPMRFNPLAAPPRPAGVAEADWVDVIGQHRVHVMTALGEASLLRPLTGAEENGVDLALAAATRSEGTAGRWAQPTLGHLADWLLNPDPAEIAAAGIPDVKRFSDDLYDLGLRYRHLVRGVFASVIDVDETASIDMSGAGVVVDMSRLHLNDAALALVVTCTQSAIELGCQFDPTPWFVVYDEVWRYMRFLGLMRRLAHRMKVVRRMDGGIPIVVSHRASDWTTGIAEIDAVAKGIIEDIQIHVTYRQTATEAKKVQELQGLTSSESELLPTLAQGHALWRIGNKSRLIQHHVLRDGLEWPLIDTDTPITDGYRNVLDPTLITDQPANHHELARNVGEQLQALFTDDNGSPADERPHHDRGPAGQ